MEGMTKACAEEVSAAWGALMQEHQRHSAEMKKLLQDLNIAQVRLATLASMVKS